MSTATVTSKGQVTIPLDVRNAMGITAGDKLEFVKMENGHFAVFPQTNSVKALKGIIRKLDRPVSIEEMNEAIADAASGK